MPIATFSSYYYYYGLSWQQVQVGEISVDDNPAGLQTLRRAGGGLPLPSARLVSSMIAEDHNVPHHIQSLWLMIWGQFIDHDLSHTALSKDVLHPSGTLVMYV